MVLETTWAPYYEWFPDALGVWGLAMLGLFVLGVVVAWARYALRLGFLHAGEVVVTGFLGGVSDLLQTSPRRTMALAWLAVKESIRSRAIAGFGVFLLVLAFALWFLDPASIYDPAALYQTFVLRAMTYLSMLLAVVTSVFSLPNDMRNKTIYTIVTKPVRSSEIVLGRILGFAAIGTVQLVAMGLIGYLFIVRSLDHTHTIRSEDLKPVESLASASMLRGETSRALNHAHTVTRHGEGQITLDEKQGHWHAVQSREVDGQTVYDVSPPLGQFHARVPLYGELWFVDSTGTQRQRGVNVGNIWTYRSYIEGGSLSSGVWKFNGVTPTAFPEGLRVEMTVRVFRTHKEGMDRPVFGSVVLRNPRTGRMSSPRNFPAKEFVIDRLVVPRALTDSTGATIDLFQDLVVDGEIEVYLSCLQRGQFFGMAQADLYLLAREESVALNFVKGVLGIWMQMILVTAYGVVFSTFLNAAVSLLSTGCVLLGGVFRNFIEQLIEGRDYTEGPFTSLVRIVYNQSSTMKLEEGLGKDLAESGDAGFRWLMEGISYALPDFRRLDSIDYVTAGFDVAWNPLVLTQATMTLGLFIPLVIVGYSCLRAREVAA